MSLRPDCSAGHEPIFVRIPGADPHNPVLNRKQCARCGLMQFEDGSWEKPLQPRRKTRRSP